MKRKLTVTLEPALYSGLYKVAGKGNISSFLEDLIRPHVVDTESRLERQYLEEMADEAAEVEAEAWAETTIADLALDEDE